MSLIVLCWTRTRSQHGISWDRSRVTAKIDLSQEIKLLFAWDFPRCLKVSLAFQLLWILSRITSGCADCLELAARRKEPLSQSNPLHCGGTHTKWDLGGEQWQGGSTAQSWMAAQLITTPPLTVDCTDTHLLYFLRRGLAEMCQQHRLLKWHDSDCSLGEENCDTKWTEACVLI